MGFGNRFTERSEYYSELSYIAKTPFYDYESDKLSGLRIISQYRYHFLQNWKPIINTRRRSRERRGRQQPIAGIEFRFKNFNFSGENNFYKDLPADTIAKFHYNANATVLGGALVFGSTYKISRNAKWNVEITAGIGARVKFVNYQNLPDGYKILKQKRLDFFGPPSIDEAIGLPYFPFAIKIKYMLD